MLKIGYNNLPNFKDINFNSSRQGILYSQLLREGIIKEAEVVKLLKNNQKVSHWIEMKYKNNKITADYVDKVAQKLLKEGAIYDSLDKIADSVVKRSLSNGGATIYTPTGLAAGGGYALAIANSPEEKFSELTVDIVTDYIERNYDSFLKNEGYFLGTWLNEGTWYLDVSELIIGEDKKDEALKLANEIREKGKTCDLDYSKRKFAKQIEKAGKLANTAVIIGENELKSNTLTVKNLETYEQTSVSRDEYLNSLTSR